MKINLRSVPGYGGDTSIDYVELPEAPVNGDIVVDTHGRRWRVVLERTWVAPTKNVQLEVIVRVRPE